jgi:hypothetical protein
MEVVECFGDSIRLNEEFSSYRMGLNTAGGKRAAQRAFSSNLLGLESGEPKHFGRTHVISELGDRRCGIADTNGQSDAKRGEFTFEGKQGVVQIPALHRAHWRAQQLLVR